MAAALAGLVLKQLGSLAADQASLLWGLKTELPKLANTVSSIQAVLLDAEEQSGKNYQIQLWLQRLEEVLYDAEDLLDDFSTEVLRRNQMDASSVVNEVFLFFSPSNQVDYGLRIANQIKAIQSKLDEIDQNRKQFDFQTRPVDPAVDEKAWRQTHSSVPDVVVGREKDKQKIIDMMLLSSYKEKVAVVPIIGIGGLGKTTLAQLIYNDDITKSHFACRVWVCVSENFHPKLLVKKILESITRKKVEDLELNTLKDLLHEEIKNKQILLVLDDVWNEDREKWGCFQSLFASGAAEGSRMIVTTRLRIVAEMTATATIVPHELQGLSEPESWSLFQKMASKGGVALGPRYAEIGKGVVRKCRGVPLALRTMGSLLSFKETESEWEAIRDKQLLSLDFGGIESEILATTLRLSYDHLPSQLKRCFVYCSLFPKDHEINVKMLVQLWMAQGYITKSSQSSILEDVGFEYFKNLLWRSFFQEVTKDACGNMESCKMHDLMHDLAVTVAGDGIICLNASNLTDSLLSSGNVNLERIRHLSIDFQDTSRDEPWQVPTVLAKATRLHTFLIINVSYRGVHLQGRYEKIFGKMTRLRVLGIRRARMESLSFIFNTLKHLRYLDLSFNDMHTLLSTVHKLKHLRYLDLCGNDMETLPNEITRLVNLQVLNLGWCQNLRLLPADIGKLSNLVHLDLGYCESLTYIPAGIGNLSSIRELSEFLVTEKAAADGSAAGLGLLKNLNNLSGKLTITGLERVKWKSEAEAANLKEKSQLQSLQLQWNSGSSNVARVRCDDERSVLEALQPHPNLKELLLYDYGGTSIPTTSCWFSSLRYLVQMHLYDCMKLQSLPSLGPFLSLQKLVLWGLESLEYVQSETVASSSSPSCSNNDLQFLPSLESLVIKDCRNLLGWSTTNTEEPPLLPRISSLEISGCPKMVSVPCFRVNFETVQLRNANSELLSAFAASLVSHTAHPQRFHELHIQRVKDQDLPQRLMPQLTSLEILRIYFCHDLVTMSPSILRHLPSLQELHIWDCKVLELEDYDYGGDGDDNNNTLPLRVLPSLRIFTVISVPKLVTLPKWLQHSSNLLRLEIESCNNLKCLSSWLTKLTTLESLKVRRCDLLSGRCRSNTFEDWPNFSHISNIQIDDVDIQKDGRYLGSEQQQQHHQQQQRWQQLEEEIQQKLQQQQEASSHTQFSWLFENCFARMTCNLFQRCFLP